MNKKIFETVFLSILLTLILVLGASITVFYNTYENRISDDLMAELRFLAAAADGGADISAVTAPGRRVTLIGQDGTVIFDSQADYGSMENHLERPEVIDAIQHGYGSDKRESDTLMRNLHYAATVLSDGTILRIAVPADTLFSFMMEMLLPLAVILLALIFFVWRKGAHFRG